ncbi:hypothetical protein C5167_013864 [Papaver somniferum]|uniref:Ubiquitin-like domain-containing protein n=1 Tax=Papaver somniferum TaxID=3469 RepID=A0A4Y7J1J7_PAPSO|nr:hypothetical protein C5167_013864 [Papaver somniferum]
MAKEESVMGYSSSSNAKRARLQSTLSALLDDPILSDVPRKPNLTDVDTLINLELGSAMRISIVKMDGTSFEVAVLNSATLKELKLAIKKKTNEIEQSKMGHRHISWRHVWENFCLSYHNEKLIEDKSVLQDFGIRNNSQVQILITFWDYCYGAQCGKGEGVGLLDSRAGRAGRAQNLCKSMRLPNIIVKRAMQACDWLLSVHGLSQPHATKNSVQL